MPVEISNFRRLPSKHLIALFSLELPSGTIIHCCLLTYSDRHYRVVPPQIPMLDKGGAISRDRHGEVVFSPALSFRTARSREMFEATALEALRAQHPDLFQRHSQPGSRPIHF